MAWDLTPAVADAWDGGVSFDLADTLYTGLGVLTYEDMELTRYSSTGGWGTESEVLKPWA